MIITKETIEKVLIACNAIKVEENSECAPLADCPYGYMFDELVEKIQKRVNC